MTYAKLPDPIPGIADALAATLSQHRITEPVADALLAAGAAVQLETGEKVWVSCVVNDRPETPQIDFITVAIACKPDVTPWQKPNGQHVASVWWHGLWSANLASLGIDTVRRALMMIALGEPQPQVDVPNPASGGPTQQDALPTSSQDVHSIRTAIASATEICQPVSDVL